MLPEIKKFFILFTVGVLERVDLMKWKQELTFGSCWESRAEIMKMRGA